MNMNRDMIEEIEDAGGDPLHPTWVWFTEDGPHGPRLTWSHTREEPPGYIGINHLKDVVMDMSDSDKTFSQGLKEVVAIALRTGHPELIQRGIQVAAASGLISELDTIIRLTNNPVDSVAKTARAGAFHIKKCS